MGLLLKEKNLLLEEQILSFMSRHHLEELSYSEKQTRIHASKYKIIVRKEAGGHLSEQWHLSGFIQ